ncbi:MAG: N-acetylmuramoyl-L-alanine amidase [Armatimonadota bacterium]
MRSGIIWLLVAGLAAVVVAPAAGQAAIRVIVNGSPLTLAAPPILQGGQVMVPAARAFEAFSAAAVWLPNERALVISNRTGLTIRLHPGEPTAHVNGQPRTLPAAPMLVGDLVFVPAQFVFAALGAWVRYDEPARVLHVASQITGLSVQRAPDAVRVLLDATGPLRVESRTLPNPDRLVVDLHGGAFRLADQDIAVRHSGVTRLRAAQFQIKPYVTRIVFDLLQPVDVRIAMAPRSFDVTLEVSPRGAVTASAPPPAFAPAPAPAPVAATPGPTTPPVAAPVPPPAPGGSPMHEDHNSQAPPGPAYPVPDDGTLKILQVRIEQPGGRFRVLIEGTRPFEHTIRELVDPDRLVIDVAGAVFVPTKQEIPVAGALVAEVRAAQFQADPDVTRVVVVLRRKAAYTVTPGENGNTLVIDIPDPSTRGHVVAIDAGHGGRDMGATGATGLLEKDLVLDVAQRVRELLVRAGIRVVMTRETDVYVDLAERPRAARAQGATVFVSIHGNASTRPATTGSETYYLMPQGLALAQMIQDELAKVAGLASRGVKTANFLVLRENDVPAVLVEVGYLSNAEEEARLRADAFRQRVAEAIMRGVQRFLVVYPVPSN